MVPEAHGAIDNGAEKSEPAMKTMLDKQMRKTKLCHFHQIGVCKHGASCAFAHEVAELQSAPNLRKTRLCKAFAAGRCNDNQCNFAHGQEELRATPLCYKTSMCVWYAKGKCVNGNLCRFAHGRRELRGDIGSSTSGSSSAEDTYQQQPRQQPAQQPLPPPGKFGGNKAPGAQRGYSGDQHPGAQQPRVQLSQAEIEHLLARRLSEEADMHRWLSEKASGPALRGLTRVKPPNTRHSYQFQRQQELEAAQRSGAYEADRPMKVMIDETTPGWYDNVLPANHQPHSALTGILDLCVQSNRVDALQQPNQDVTAQLLYDLSLAARAALEEQQPEQQERRRRVHNKISAGGDSTGMKTDETQQLADQITDIALQLDGMRTGAWRPRA
jgi:hypothetical protein